MRAVDALEVLELVGSSQWGLVTSSQAQHAGVSIVRLARFADQGTIQRIRHGVYALPSADSGPFQALRAAWLATGSEPHGHQPTAVVSGESAAALHRLGNLLPSVHEFSTSARRQTTQPDIRYRKRELGAADVTQVDGLPVTTVARTVADLATGSTDFDNLADVVRDAMLYRDTTRAQLAEALDPAAGRFGFKDGTAVLDALLKSAGSEPDAVPEAMSPELRAALLRSMTPELQSTVNQMVKAQVQQLLPHLDVTSVITSADEAVRPHRTPPGPHSADRTAPTKTNRGGTTSSHGEGK